MNKFAAGHKRSDSPNASSFLLRNFRSGKFKYPTSAPPLLERANTVASGLGSAKHVQLSTWDSNEDVASDGCLSSFHSSSLRHARPRSDHCEAYAEFHNNDDEESPKLTRFCRGSIKRLKHAESKVSTAKRDMEQILASAKSESDLNDDLPNFGAELLKAQTRLDNDTRLALEAQSEMRRILVQFANLLQEEEEQVSIKADLLQRTSSQIKFACVTMPVKKHESEQVHHMHNDGDERDEVDDHDDGDDDDDEREEDRDCSDAFNQGASRATKIQRNCRP
ncbi:uncharacterized protein DDB_G0283697-like [Tigriopus californicus]|uniref:uncharacterized protein DDB_G0283697-like n=1 Tax=Tigriopus californicus TaxID=6832 RepID=UPI0027DA5DFE|nr:uncharacterized protein DDB_G0283697-like [Tigriopus californicus]